jgi:pimeloyl-ACP methyl ester carboxylesterase
VVLLGHSMGGGIAAMTAASHPRDVGRIGLLDAAGVRFRDNRFGVEVLAGRNPFAVDDADSLQRYVDTVFFDAAAKPTIPWPADDIYIARRKRDAAFEQSVLDRIGRGPERFLPGEAAARIRQPALLLWCEQDAVIDSSAMALYAARMPQARQVLLDGCGHMSLMERPDAVAQAVIELAGTR